MRTRLVPRLLTASAALALAACGGGALLLLGFIGSAGGDWIQDDPAQAWAALAGREQVALQCFRDGHSRRVELRRERFFPLLR